MDYRIAPGFISFFTVKSVQIFGGHNTSLGLVFDIDSRLLKNVTTENSSNWFSLGHQFSPYSINIMRIHLQLEFKANIVFNGLQNILLDYYSQESQPKKVYIFSQNSNNFIILYSHNKKYFISCLCFLILKIILEIFS